jgi:predicted phosphodiesterase
MGNYDQGIGFETGDCGCVYKTDEQRAEGAVSLDWTQRVASEEVKAYLRTLEDHFVLQTPGGDILAVHGSPRRINEYLFEDRPTSALARIATSTLTTDGLPYRAILFGHTHLPYTRHVPTGAPARPLTTLVNVGSAGRPKDGDWRACYALLNPPTSADTPVDAQFVRVPYDFERLVRAVAATSLTTVFDGPPAPDLPRG